MKVILISNNPSVISKYAHMTPLVEKRYYDVLVHARNLIHDGAKLVSHPQAGSVKPHETPYRSLLLKLEGDELDTYSLSLIENAIERYLSLTRNLVLPEDRKYTDQLLDDFQFIDLSLIEQAIDALS